MLDSCNWSVPHKMFKQYNLSMSNKSQVFIQDTGSLCRLASKSGLGTSQLCLFHSNKLVHIHSVEHLSLLWFVHLKKVMQSNTIQLILRVNVKSNHGWPKELCLFISPLCNRALTETNFDFLKCTLTWNDHFNTAIILPLYVGHDTLLMPADASSSLSDYKDFFSWPRWLKDTIWKYDQKTAWREKIYWRKKNAKPRQPFKKLRG